MPARLMRRIIAFMAIAGLSLAPAAARADDILVFAAASLKTALDEIAAGWQARSGVDVTISYGGSAQLARQIDQGAPADIFISASREWMDYLAAAERIIADHRIDLLGNRLVLIAHGREAAPVELGPGTDLAGLIGDGRLAMGLVESVPAGIYGKAALIHLGLWDKVSTKVAQSDNVRAALALVSSGEAPYGIVYATDAAADKTVSVVAVFPEGSHDPIVYPAALVASSENPDARDFFAALSSPESEAVFARHGFLIPARRGDG